jgi:hypothetical protein
MLNYPNPDDPFAVTRQRQARPSAQREESARLWQKAVRYCLFRRQSIELLPTQGNLTIVKLESAPGNHPSTAPRVLQSQLVTYSTRSLNSK